MRSLWKRFIQNIFGKSDSLQGDWLGWEKFDIDWFDYEEDSLYLDDWEE